MKIIHILFDDYPYLFNWGYQENKFVKYEIQKHDVTIVAGNYVPKILKKNLGNCDLKDYEEINVNGHLLKVYRLKCMFGNTLLGSKIKYYYKMSNVLKKEKPDIIFVHDLHATSLITLNRFLKKII